MASWNCGSVSGVDRSPSLHASNENIRYRSKATNYYNRQGFIWPKNLGGETWEKLK